LKTYEQTIALTRATGDELAAEDVPESLVQAILNAREARSQS
jgi:hypothetical protein